MKTAGRKKGFRSVALFSIFVTGAAFATSLLGGSPSSIGLGWSA